MKLSDNLIFQTDSYKLGHWSQYPADTTGVFSYMEARKDAEFPESVFFGLQYTLKAYLEGQVVTDEMLEKSKWMAAAHFGQEGVINEAGWRRIIDVHGGRLPVRIKAVPEGTVVPVDNVLMTIENTDPELPWLTNALESQLMHVWYPTTTATLSRDLLAMIGWFLNETSDSPDLDTILKFMLHDFGYRSASSHESAAVGGMGHLVNGWGTDTLPAIEAAIDFYNAQPSTLAYSVPATEHSTMSARGRGGEDEILRELFVKHPTGIISIVGDTYNIYQFVKHLGSEHKEAVLARDGRVVVRPDSTTDDHPTPAKEVVWIQDQLWNDFGGHPNSKGYKVLDPHVGQLWGDGIAKVGMRDILSALQFNSYSTENQVFGVGSGLLQKVDRDVQSFATKMSAIKRGGVWHDAYKQPLGDHKVSKKGRLALVDTADGFRTVREDLVTDGSQNQLVTVFEDGELLQDWTFDEIRERAVTRTPVFA